MIDPGLLIVGGLTIDRFPDGATAPGGSVLHAGVAAVAEGVRPTFLTVAGDEPEARDGLRRLAELGDLIRQVAPSTTAYRHREADGRRVLVYESAATPFDPARHADVPRGGVALLAPIADELPAAAVEAVRRDAAPRSLVLLIQGWLRRLELGEAVHPVPLDALPPEAWAVFGTADAIVVSTEDLAETTPQDPFAQAAAVRSRVGPRPIVVLTLGVRGYLLDDPRADRIVASRPRRVVESVPTVGAGDTFGAVMAIHLARGASPIQAADAGSNCVIRILEARR